MDKVSVIIPSYNRFLYLIHAVQSIKNQDYPNIEIIVINDGSTQPEYYNHNWAGIRIIHLIENSKKKFGYPCVGYVRNQGIKESNGKYIAFCDDDDYWLPGKITKQLNLMNKFNCYFSCTEGLIGKGKYNKLINYKKYNQEYYLKKINKKYKHINLLKDGFPMIWDKKFINIHNCIICSSVIIDKKILNNAGNMPYKRRGQDYLCWLKCLKYSNVIFIHQPYVYYDLNHGSGSNH